MSIRKPTRRTGENMWVWAIHMTNSNREKIRLLQDFERMWNGSLLRSGIVKHLVAFTLPHIPQMNFTSYMAKQRAREFGKTGIDKKLQLNIIEPAQSDSTSLIAFVRMDYGSFQFCVDYCKFEVVILKDAYPVLRMDECIDSSGEARIFSKLDA